MMNPPNFTDTNRSAWKFVGQVLPAPVSFFYKIGLSALAIAMVLLPVLYVAFIVLVVYAVYRHTVCPSYTLGSGLIALLGYVAPIIVGTILVFFMIKPLFARRPEEVEAQPLLPEDEPELFRFVNTICDLVRAPRPRRVQVDLRVNAAAGFRRGMLDLFGRNLTLTIGLPLVAGLNIREFGGVLAHEFGHFAQGAAMRLTFIVRSVNNWFGRVVYERDVWDERLRSAASRTDFRLRIILGIALGAVWLTRRILWLLMHIGHGISCFMMRQMEFDADNFETQIAGSVTFSATARRLQLLNVAWQRALAFQQEVSLTNRLVDDLPGLVAITANRLPEKVRQTVEQAFEGAETGWFDTHPADCDRINASKALGCPGALEAEGEAALLFRSFAATAEKQTTAYYEQQCGIELKNMLLRPFELMVEEAETAGQEDICIENFFGPLLDFRTRLLIKLEDVPPPDEVPSAMQHSQLLNDAKSVVDVVSKADGEERTAFAAVTLLKAGFTINHKEFGLSDATLKAAEAAVAHAQQRLQKESAKLGAALRVSGQRLAAALAAYRNSSEPAAKAEVGRFEELLAGFAAVGAALIRVRNRSLALELLLSNPAGELNSNRWNTTATELSTLIEQDLARVLAQFESHDYPFAHAQGKIPLSEFFVESPPNMEAIPRACLRGNRIVERASAMHYRILAKLAAFAQRSDSMAPSGAANQSAG